MGIDLIKHLCSICYFVFVSFDIDILSNAEHKCGLSDSQPVAILTHLFSSSIKSQTTISMLMLYSLLPEITQYRFWRWFNILYGHSGTFDWSWQAGNLRTEWRVSPTSRHPLQLETKAIRRFEKISQLALSHLRHYWDPMLNGRWPHGK